MLVDGEIDDHLGVVSPLLEDGSQGSDLVRVAQVASEEVDLNALAVVIIVSDDDDGVVSAHVGADVVHVELRALVCWLVDQLDYYIFDINQIHR